jgi:hypothetical protein
MNAIRYGEKRYLRTHQDAYADLVYEEIPFTCDRGLSDQSLKRRLQAAVLRRFPPRNGYGCDVTEVRRDAPDGGNLVLRHYHGIGD